MVGGGSYPSITCTLRFATMVISPISPVNSVGPIVILRIAIQLRTSVRKEELWASRPLNVLAEGIQYREREALRTPPEGPYSWQTHKRGCCAG